MIQLASVSHEGGNNFNHHFDYEWNREICFGLVN